MKIHDERQAPYGRVRVTGFKRWNTVAVVYLDGLFQGRAALLSKGDLR